MVNKTTFIAVALSTAAFAVPLSSNVPAGEDRIEAREPMRPPPGGFRFDRNRKFIPAIVARGINSDMIMEAREPLLPRNREESLESREPLRYVPEAYLWDHKLGRNNKLAPVNARGETSDLEVREPLNGPPVGWMSPWWNGKPVGQTTRWPQMRPKREVDGYDRLVAREPIPSPPPGHERHCGNWVQCMRMRTAPMVALPRNANAGLETREDFDARGPRDSRNVRLLPPDRKSPLFNDRRPTARDIDELD